MTSFDAEYSIKQILSAKVVTFIAAKSLLLRKRQVYWPNKAYLDAKPRAEISLSTKRLYKTIKSRTMTESDAGYRFVIGGGEKRGKKREEGRESKHFSMISHSPASTSLSDFFGFLVLLFLFFLDRILTRTPRVILEPEVVILRFVRILWEIFEVLLTIA